MIKNKKNYKCIVCSSTNFKKKYEILLECSDCNHVFADVQLSKDKLEKLYGIDYFKGDEYADYIEDVETIKKNFYLRIKTLMKYTQKSSNQSLLEIGCAFGFFLDISSQYFKNNVGIDISREAIKYAKNKKDNNNYIHGSFIEKKFNDNSFNVICLWDTIEHLTNPEKYIEKISKLLLKGGKLALTTGDISSFISKIRKKNWRMIHPPTHIHYFTTESLCKLLEKNNFKIIYKKKCGFYRNIASMAYMVFVVRLKIPIFYTIIKFIKLDSLNLYLNLYDIDYVIAEKK